MAWKYPLSTWQDGDLTTPHEPNVEFANVASEMRGLLDRDNLQEGIVELDNITAGTFHRLGFTTDANTGARSKVAENAVGGEWQPVDARTTMTCQDSLLNIDALASWTAISMTHPQAWFELGLRVDGLVVANSDAEDTAQMIGGEQGVPATGSAYLMACVPVGAGEHVIELCCRIYGPGQVSVNVDNSALSVVEERR